MVRYAYKLFEKGHSWSVGLKVKIKCLPLGGLGRGGTLFLGGRAGMSCFRLKGSSTKPYIKLQRKEKQRVVIRHTRCKPHKLWAEHQSKPHLINVMLQTREKVLCLRCKCTNERCTFDIWLKSANPLLLPNELLPNGSKVPKKSGVGRGKTMKHN